MPWTQEGKAVMLVAARDAISHMSIHNAKPVDGLHELPQDVYRRRQVDFKDPVAGEAKSERPVRFDIPPGGHVAYAGFWTRSIGGVMLAWAPLPEKRTFHGRGILEVDLAVLDLNLDESEQ